MGSEIDVSDESDVGIEIDVEGDIGRLTDVGGILV